MWQLHGNELCKACALEPTSSVFTHAHAREHMHRREREKERAERAERESQAECFKTPFHSQLFSRLRLELWLQLYGSALLSGIVWVLCRLSVPTEVRPIVPHRLSSHMQQLRVPAPAANRAHLSCVPNDYPQARMGQTKNVQLLPAPQKFKSSSVRTC